MNNISRHHIQSLHVLRFIFIFLIFISHFSWNDSGYWDFGGDCGVCFFFMLSGFVLSLPEDAERWRDFVGKRFSKIYPTHLFVLLIAFLCMPWNFSLTAAGTSLALVQSWLPSREVYFGANGVAWYLSDMVLFYLLFPWLKNLLFGMKRILLVAIVLLVAALYIFLFVPNVPDDKVSWLLYVFPPVRLLDFCLGIVLARIFRYFRLKGTSLSAGISFLAEVVALLLLWGALVVYPQLPERYATASLFWIPCGLVILVFAVSDSLPGIVGRLLKRRWLLWLGALSFEFYLVHVSVIEAVRRSTDYFEVQLPYATAFILTLILAIVVSLAVKWIVGRLPVKHLTNIK